jgi:serine/threonine-protein kinase
MSTLLLWSDHVARGLGVAHVRGIVHRDVKPGNILLARDGRAMVTDFGIARLSADAEGSVPGTTLGSVHYFSPEQARGEPASQASDVYAVGIVLYEMLAGRRPWEGDSAASIAIARLSGPIPAPSSVRAGIPPILDAIDRKALASNAIDRFESASAMASPALWIGSAGHASSHRRHSDRWGARRPSAAGGEAAAVDHPRQPPAPATAPPMRPTTAGAGGNAGSAARTASPDRCSS